MFSATYCTKGPAEVRKLGGVPQKDVKSHGYGADAVGRLEFCGMTSEGEF